MWTYNINITTRSINRTRYCLTLVCNDELFTEKQLTATSKKKDALEKYPGLTNRLCKHHFGARNEAVVDWDTPRSQALLKSIRKSFLSPAKWLLIKPKTKNN